MQLALPTIDFYYYHLCIFIFTHTHTHTHKKLLQLLLLFIQFLLFKYITYASLRKEIKENQNLISYNKNHGKSLKIYCYKFE